MRIVINADDFGFDDDTVDATIEGLDRGWITSATIMVNMPASRRALAYARTRGDRSFGLHLVYTGDGIERPVLPPQEVPAMVSADGCFHLSNTTRRLAISRRVPRAQIVRETEAQLEVFEKNGLRPSHVDSHGHIHKFSIFRRALPGPLSRFGVRRVRNAQDIYLERRVLSPTYWMGPHWRARLMKAFETTQHFFMPVGGEDWALPLLASSSTATRSKSASIPAGTRRGAGISSRTRRSSPARPSGAGIG